MKGERTRREVIERAAGLFNRTGYRSTSLSDIMAVTGLQKGGLYRHFESKDELALLAFDFAVDKMTQRFHRELANAKTSSDKVRAILAVYERIPTDPPVAGGCPILNAATEADDALPALKKRAAEVMDGLLETLRRFLREGQKSGELDPDFSPDIVATVIVSALEGAVMVAKLQSRPAQMRKVVGYLHRLVDGLSTC